MSNVDVSIVKDQRGRWNTVHASVASANPAIGKKELFLACEMARSRAFSGPFVNKLPKDLFFLTGHMVADLFFLTGLMVAVSTQLNILDGKSAAVATFVVAASLLAQDVNLRIVCERLKILEGKSAAVATFVFAASLLVQAFVLPSVLGLQHYVLAPRIDMINHRGGSKSQVTYQALQASFEVVAAAPVAEGEEVFISYGTRSNDQLLQYYEGKEVFISYGTRSNDQLLQYYGFVENNNPDDVYEIPSFASRVQQVSGASIASVMEAKNLLVV
ncbi:hypothetical protein T484DRAFT_1768459 [Baffinella frigidus]|nr:hypothetical protein T484DRAFT_1768459 [Cryptophyta sp. CCMP2293]